jgi:glycosyltransferase involved in cell wall biosynthesis
MRSERPAVVHSYLFSASWRTLLVGRLAQVPLVITSVRNVDIHGGTRSHILLERALAPLNDLVIANAQAVKDHVTDVHRIASDKIRVIHNGVAVSRVKANETGAPHRGAPTVLIVASLTPKKDHATFLSAAALVHDRMPESRFIIVGDGPLKGELVRRSEELGLSGAIDFRGELEDVGAVLAEADVCALTSIKEGCSNFILESMLAGKPVVATDAGGNRELVVTGETGYIVRIGDASGVADRVCELLEDPKLARDMGERGRERVRSEFSIARMVEQTVDLYDRTLEERVEGLVEWSRARAARRTRNAPVDG